MKGIFSYDSFLFQAINKFLDSVILCLLWAAFCIPVLTIGAATTALFYTADKVIYREEGKLFSSFLHSFKQNFKQATLIGLLFGVIFLFLYLEVFFSYTLYLGGHLHITMFIVILAVTAIIIMWASYVFPYMAKYSDTTKQTFKKCAFMAVFNIHWSILLLAVICASFLMAQLVPGGIFLAPLACLMSISRITTRVFHKYAQNTDEAAGLEQEEVKSF